MKKRKKRKSRRKRIFACLIYQLIFLVITTPLWVFYGPFKNVKATIVGTAMSTFKAQRIATIFLSKDKINSIIKGSGSSSDDKMDPNEIKVSYSNNSVEVEDIHTSKFDGYMLIVKNPKSVKVGVTQKLKIEGQRTSTIAEENGAVAAINGGGFTDRSPDGKQLWVGTGAYPDGIVITDGKVKYSTLDYDTKVSATAFTKSGVMIVGNYSINELKKMDVAEALSFNGINSRLIVNGKGQIKGDGGQGLQPRTAIAQKQDGTVLMLVIDGRQFTKLKMGASLKDIQNIFLSYGAWNASNLDGGSSTTMYYRGEVINSPSDPLGERSVATIVYVKP